MVHLGYILRVFVARSFARTDSQSKLAPSDLFLTHDTDCGRSQVVELKSTLITLPLKLKEVWRREKNRSSRFSIFLHLFKNKIKKFNF